MGLIIQEENLPPQLAFPSFEDAVERELWEEAGVKVTNVRYHSSQPWVCRVPALTPV